MKKRFSKVERITSYARSHTVARIKDDDLEAMKEAGVIPGDLVFIGEHELEWEE